MFRCVVFDLDGTLVNSIDGIMVAINKTFSTIGLGPYEWEKDIERFFGKPFEIWAETLLKEGDKYSEENVKKMKELMHENYSSIGVDYVKLNPGVKEALEVLKDNGVKIALATNTVSGPPQKFLKHLGVYEYFDKICTVSDVEKGKPEPDEMICIIKSLNINPDEILVVGDSETDVEFAKNSGCKICILDAKWNKNITSDYRVKNMKELVDIVLGKR
ncbi:MAG: HAD family hydrolase [Candidatus Aenigmarchaeota archaeon]|nr:HAD family hydrolase [Candidatus Aenigmarchaeota archaeon]